MPCQSFYNDWVIAFGGPRCHWIGLAPNMVHAHASGFFWRPMPVLSQLPDRHGCMESMAKSIAQRFDYVAHQGREAASGRRYMQYAAEESCKLNATRCGWRSINSFLGDPGKIEPVTQRYSFLGTCRHSGSNLLHEEPMSSTGLISQAVRQCAPESLLGSRRSASPWADAAPSWSRCATRRPVLSSTEGRRQHRGAAWRA